MSSPQTYPHSGIAPDRWVCVALDTPGLGPLDYQDALARPVQRGDWVLVPLAHRRVIGVVLETHAGPPSMERALRPIEGSLTQIPRVLEPHIRLAQFVSRYYRRRLGSVLLAGLPAWLRRPSTYEPRSAGRPALIERMLQGLTARASGVRESPGAGPVSSSSEPLTQERAQASLTQEQAQALAVILEELAHPQPRPILIHGLTGSGKTRLYQAAMSSLLRRHPDGQVLVMVPEIGLTPQLVARMQAVFPDHCMAILHSGLTERARAEQWLLASSGRASIVVGTRLSVLCPLPRLSGIVVDEEHDASFKQQEGLPYSARDLAVWLGQDRAIPVMLASATPSLESWVQAERGRYLRVCMGSMASGVQRPVVTLIDLVRQPAERETGLSPVVRAEISSALARSEQVLLFVNRRGWAPVLVCDACGWRAECRDCGVATVLHRQRGRWRSICHHCGLSVMPPSACPDCGHQDLSTLGQGTQRLEEALHRAFPGAEVARMDRDEIRTPQALQALLQRVADQEVAILVGTQMAAKGHDFERLRLVVALDGDAQLANPDFRGPEWLYAGIAQVAGRAGRHPARDHTAAAGVPAAGVPAAQVLIQTRYPQHPVFAALIDPDPMHGFQQLWSRLAAEREQAGLPPFGGMALVRASHREASVLIAALEALLDQLLPVAQGLGARASGPVPRYPERVAGRARWQLVLEAPSRRALQSLLDRAESWVDEHRARLHAQIEVDPLGLG